MKFRLGPTFFRPAFIFHAGLELARESSSPMISPCMQDHSWFRIKHADWRAVSASSCPVGSEVTGL